MYIRFLYLLNIRGFTYASTVKIIKVLGEGGFSFVYLAQDENSGVRLRFLGVNLANGISRRCAATIRAQEDSVSDGVRGRRRSDARGGGV